MDKILSIRDKNISVHFHEHGVSIINNDGLKDLLKEDTENATDELVVEIKSQYQILFGRGFTVSDTSLAVEIWGHVYVDEFAEAVKSVSPLHLFDKLADKIKQYCDVIDIGEHGHDSNRFVWDGLAPLKPAIAMFLPHKKKK